MSGEEKPVGTGKPLIAASGTELRPSRIGIDPRSKEWGAIAAWIDKRLGELEHACSRAGITERMADEHRGAIRELEGLRDLNEARKRLPSDIY